MTLPLHIFFLSTIILTLPLLAVEQSLSAPEKILYNFEEEEQLSGWRVVNDGVMGGISRGQMNPGENNSAVFSGEISLENNGGFSSVRTAPREYGLQDFSGILLRVRGDGKKYQLRLRMDERFDGIAYRYPFIAENQRWTIIKVEFSQCVPVFRGRIIRDAPPLLPSDIQQLGFLIADKQQGPFRLEIDWIGAYR